MDVRSLKYLRQWLSKHKFDPLPFNDSFLLDDRFEVNFMVGNLKWIINYSMHIKDGDHRFIIILKHGLTNPKSKFIYKCNKLSFEKLQFVHQTISKRIKL